MFAKGNELVTIAKRHKVFVGCVAVVLFSQSMYVYILGWHDTHKAVAVVSFILAGFASFIAMYSCINITTENRVVKWLSGISYEIYLTHMPIIPISGMVFSNPWMRICLGIVLTIVFAIVLNKVSNKIIRFIK